DNGEVFLEKTYPKDQHWVSLSEISPYVINGFIATEDKNFYSHFGFDIPRIMSAVINNVVSGSKSQGASTISQQYARNLFLNFDKTWERKIKEAFYTFQLEINYDKDTILEGYLNTINFGHGNYGIEDAALYYYGKHAKDLTLDEAAVLVSIPKGPSYYSPIANYENNLKRKNIVLSLMLKEGYITEEEHDKAVATEAVVIGEKPEEVDYEAPYYIDALLSEVDKLLNDRTMSYRHLNIYTTLNQEIQNNVNTAIENEIKVDDIQTAVIVMDPSNGHVKALAGGVDYETSQFNRALYSVRQPGSMMKPLLYYAALEYGFTPSTTFMNEPTTFYYDNGSSYSPNNYSKAYAYEEISMANAIAVSDNIYAVKTHMFLGESVLPTIAKRMGITTEIPEIPSAVLGVTPISIMEMTEAYGLFANSGKEVNRTFITQITDDRDFLVYAESNEKSKQILRQEETYVMNEMLTGMFNSDLNNHLAVTGLSIAPKLTRTYAGKSGTTNTDSWMIGYTPTLLTTVWTGYDQGQTLDGVEVNRYAKNIWADIMESSLEGTEEVWFKRPNDVVPVSVDPISGSLASSECDRRVTLYYISDNTPTLTCRKSVPVSTNQTEDSNDDAVEAD
ncbi:MAG TPA: penicillin-binding protein, partial [Firmicutes bacterium]|nr:penicillin-binding protein [Bacillota bacterium]